MKKLCCKIRLGIIILLFVMLFAGCSAENKVGENAEIIIPFEYEDIIFIGDYYYAVKEKDSTYKIIDAQGNTISQSSYDSIKQTTIDDKTYYFFEVNNDQGELTKGLLDENGMEITLPEDTLYLMEEGDTWSEFKYGYKIRKTDEWKIPAIYDSAGPFIDGIAVVSEDYIEQNRRI